jgi:hypothetical protein
MASRNSQNLYGAEIPIVYPFKVVKTISDLDDLEL